MSDQAEATGASGGTTNVGQLLESVRGRVELKLVAGTTEVVRDITSAEIHRPGLFLAGFEEGYEPDRIQVLGGQEMAYLASLEADERRRSLSRLLTRSLPCVIVGDGARAGEELVELAGERDVPVFESPVPAARLARQIGAMLEDLLAPSTTIHGTLVDVYGVGMLFTGKSGIGKSECGLDLVEHGHRLVADDVVQAFRTPQGYLVGTGSDLLRHYMEIRGVGIIDVRSMFGVRATRQKKRIEMQVNLVRWAELTDYERLGFEDEMTEILGVRIPVVALPLVPGKNITVISEVIALNHLLKLRGVHPAREFDQRLKALTMAKGRADRILRSDSE
ncbi:MAG: HPr(Ser) kinase/phosphatase [Candidatus Eisenbacteria bacterium]|nr:HPr(Ser) kinase/phosphatase [Candidatus Eisenbacteria bacterium]